MDKSIKNQILEALAEVEHRQWSEWASSVKDEVSEERRARWENYMVPYDQLDEKTKELDREWAEEAYKAIEPMLAKLMSGPVKEMVTKVEVDSNKFPGIAKVLAGV